MDPKVAGSWPVSHPIIKIGGIVVVYQSSFINPIEINTPKDAYLVILHMCTWYCNKDAIDKLHCSGHDATLCSCLKKKIINDFLSNA